MANGEALPRVGPLAFGGVYPSLACPAVSPEPADDELAALRDELARVRDEARARELELGELRGSVVRLERALFRAHQREVVMRKVRGVGRRAQRLTHRWRSPS